MRTAEHKIISNSEGILPRRTSYQSIKNLQDLLTKLGLKALYLHEFKYHRTNSDVILVRRLEEYGETRPPRCGGILPLDTFDDRTTELLDRYGIVKKGKTKLFVQETFDEQERSFLQGQLRKEGYDEPDLKMIYQKLNDSRRYFRPFRWTEFRDDIVSYLVEKNLVVEEGDHVVITARPEEVNDLRFPKTIGLNAQEKNKIRGILRDAVSNSDRRIPRDAFKTRDPLAETLYADQLTFVIGEKNKQINYKIRCGRYILTFVPRRDDLDEDSLFFLMQLVQNKFIELMSKALEKDMDDLSVRTNQEYLSRKKTDPAENTAQANFAEPTTFLLRIFKDIIKIGCKYCDLRGGQINIVPTANDDDRGLTTAKFEKFRMTMRFSVFSGTDDIYIDQCSFRPLPELPPNNSDLKCSTYRTEKGQEIPIITPGLHCEFILGSDSHYNLSEDEANCLNAFKQRIRLLLSNALVLYEAEKSEILATRDGLTGLYNRLFFDNKYEESYDAFLNGSIQLGLILFDLDDLKIINDSLGHQRGDLVLKWIGRTFRAVFERENAACQQEKNFSARFGGDEFIGLLLDKNDEELERIGMEIFSALTEPSIPMTLSLVKDSEKVHVVDLVDLLYRFMNKEVKEKSENFESDLRSKRDLLFKRYSLLVQQEKDDERKKILDTIKIRLARVSDSLELSDEELKALNTENMPELLEKLFNCSDDRYKQIEQTRILMQQDITSFVGKFLLKKLQCLFHMDQKSQEDVVKKFIELQYENAGNLYTDILREKLCKQLGYDSLDARLCFKLSMGIGSAGEKKIPKGFKIRANDNLVQIVDHRLYRAKLNGKNSIYSIGEKELSGAHLGR